MTASLLAGPATQPDRARGHCRYRRCIAFVGRSLDVDEWVLRLSPLYSVGFVPAEDPSSTALTVLTVIAIVVAAAVGVVGFRRRDIPIGGATHRDVNRDAVRGEFARGTVSSHLARRAPEPSRRRRNSRFYVVAYDGLDPLSGRARRRWIPTFYDRTFEPATFGYARTIAAYLVIGIPKFDP